MRREQKHAPEETQTIPMDDISLVVTYKVNRDRPRDEPPEVYDVTYALENAEWLSLAVHEAIVERVWEAEIKQATDEYLARRDDGPEYDPDEPRKRT